MNPNKYFAGIDVGSAFTKAMIMKPEGDLLGMAVLPSGIDFQKASEACLNIALSKSGRTRQEIEVIVATGYGRRNVSCKNADHSEIGCHAKGCYYFFPRAISVIDIGGQDNKIINLDDHGRRIDFKMNRKCAAGTGAFLEEMAGRLRIPISELNDLAKQSTAMVRLNSFCTVFAGTEVLEHIRAERKVEDIVKGIFYSVIIRVKEMAYLQREIVATGGVVAHNPYLVKMAETVFGKRILVPQYPQFTGAIGAAIHAMELAGVNPQNFAEAQAPIGLVN